MKCDQRRGARPNEKVPRVQSDGNEEKEAVCRVIDSGFFALPRHARRLLRRPEVQAAEREWGEFGVKHVVAVNSCTSASPPGVEGAAGDDVSPHHERPATPRWSTTPSLARGHRGGALLPDPRSVEARIAHGRGRSSWPIFGQPYDREAINAIAKKHGAVIEDASAPGATWKEPNARRHGVLR